MDSDLRCFSSLNLVIAHQLIGSSDEAIVIDTHCIQSEFSTPPFAAQVFLLHCLPEAS